MNHSGLCKCGCGKTTPVAKRTHGRSGHIKGQHTDFCRGHGGRALVPKELPSGCQRCGGMLIGKRIIKKFCNECLRLNAREIWRKEQYHRRRASGWLDKYRLWTRRKLYGISPEHFDAILASQGVKCAICRRGPESMKKGWHVDHDHKNGLVRGILCNLCNNMLGLAKDSRTTLMSAAAYLGRPSSCGILFEEVTFSKPEESLSDKIVRLQDAS